MKYVWKTHGHFLHGCLPALEWQFNKTDDAQLRPLIYEPLMTKQFVPCHIFVYHRGIIQCIPSLHHCASKKGGISISIVKPTRCTIFRVYWISLSMFWTVFPSIIRSSRLYIHHQVYVIRIHWLLASSPSSISCPLASSQRTCMTYTWCCVYSLELLMMEGKTIRNM